MKSFVWFLCGVLCGSFATLWFVQAQSGREQAAFRQGYNERDLEAYSSLHTYHSMLITVRHSARDFELMGDGDGKPTNVKFCDPFPFYAGTKFRTLSFYYRDGCLSFNGPKAELDPEMENGKPIIHQIAMKEGTP